MKEVVRKEVLKWLNVGFIYVISDSPWVSPVHVVPKNDGFIVENAKTSIEHLRRLNLVMKEVVRKEVLKWLNVGFIYVISDNPWVSPVHVVPKNGGFIVIRNEKNELIPIRTVTGWRVCIDYRN